MHQLPFFFFFAMTMVNALIIIKKATITIKQKYWPHSAQGNVNRLSLKSYTGKRADTE